MNSTRPIRPSRIAIVLPAMLPLGGLERLVISQGRIFAAWGYEVDFVLVNEPQDLTATLGFPARVFNFGVKRLRSVIGPLARYLRTERPDAVHVCLWPLTTLAIAAHRLTRSPARLVVSDHNNLSQQYGGRGRLHRLALRASIAATYRLAHGRVAVSQGVAEELAAISGLASDRFTVIHNPMPLAAPDSSLKATSFDDVWGGFTGPRILSVGRMKRQKNHALLLRAFRRLIETVDARLVILGDGMLEEETRALVDAEGLSGKAFLPGQVENPEPYYASADMFVLSSDYEGFGNVLVEALAFGLPIVSTDCRSGPAEILENGRWGRLTPVGDVECMARAMIETLNADHDRDALRSRAADFSPEIAARRYLDLLAPGRHADRAPAEAMDKAHGVF